METIQKVVLNNGGNEIHDDLPFSTLGLGIAATPKNGVCCFCQLVVIHFFPKIKQFSNSVLSQAGQPAAEDAAHGDQPFKLSTLELHWAMKQFVWR